MPNWCLNTATISGPAPVIDEIKQVLASEERELLKWMVPEPKYEGESDWYAWRVENWGTKWDVCDVCVDNDTEEDSVSFTFSTAWSPPIDAFKTWAEEDGRVKFSLDYYEPGMGYLGTADYDGEYFDDQIVEMNSDPELYKSIAEDKWGEVFDEDEEPFTEWYLQGVEDTKKGSE